MSEIVNKAEAANSNYIRDVQNCAYALDWSETEFIEKILTAYAQLGDVFTDANGRPVELNTACLEADWSPDEAKDGHGEMTDEEAEAFEKAHQERLRLWCRDRFCRPCQQTVNPHIQEKIMPQFLVIASILKAMHPAQAATWGTRPVENAGDNGDNTDTTRYLEAHGRRRNRLLREKKIGRAMRLAYRPINRR